MTRAIRHQHQAEQWMDEAACVNVPDFHLSTDLAVLTCVPCPVRTDCLSYAMRIEAADPAVDVARFGEVYGGLTGSERARLRRSAVS